VDPNNGRYMMRGSDCVYTGPSSTLSGKACTITKMQVKTRSSDRNLILARFDYDGRERVVDIRNLTPKGHAMKNFKTLVKAALDTLLKPLDADSAKEQAVRKLGVAAELVRTGEAEKKKAKTELTKLGIITGDVQNGVVFDSDRYVVTATTKAASTRLEAGALTAALANEGLSQAMQRRIIAAATIENKAATSFTVESK
jgi:hypothetical protein